MGGRITAFRLGTNLQRVVYYPRVRFAGQRIGIESMPYKNKEKQRAHDAERLRQRKVAGKCASCNEDAIPGESRCQKCKDDRRIR